MVTYVAVLTDGTHTANLSNVQKYEIEMPTNIAEIPIPMRQGGQIQFLGSPQRRITLSGVLVGSTEVGYFLVGGAIDLMRINTGADTTLTLNYAGTQVYTGTCRIRNPVAWPIKSSQMYWWGFSLPLTEKV